MPVFDGRAKVMYEVGPRTLKLVYRRSEIVADTLHFASHADVIIWIYETRRNFFLSKVAYQHFLYKIFRQAEFS